MATNFFDQQDAARRTTRRLVAYFTLAVATIVLTIYAIFALAVHVKVEKGPDKKSHAHLDPHALWDPSLFLAVAAGTLSLVAGGSVYKVMSLRSGGEAVARTLEGRPIDPGTTDPAERRLLNIVEEMALASGTPVPPVYLLEDEPGINAFAAGFAPGDAVIGVTRGALEYLTRDELQGVVAHEFSHILNGDMRLDIKLMGLLHGILMIAIVGEIVMRWAGSSSSSRRSDDDKKDSGASLFILGVALFLIGWIGVFFGKLIKSAVSRQREFLADASSVQFTRNPAGIAGALKKIAVGSPGSRIRNPHAEEASHMFFGNAVKEFQGADLLSTHPPLVERIMRVEPDWDFSFPDVEPVDAPRHAEDSSADDGVGDEGVDEGEYVDPGLAFLAIPEGATVPLAASEAMALVGTPGPEHVAYATSLVSSMPEALTAAAREPFGARCVVYALLLDPDESARNLQLDLLRRHANQPTCDETRKLRPLVDPLGAEARVPLVDMTLPALKNLSANQYGAFREQVRLLVEADQRITLFEFVLQRMLTRHLDQQFGKRTAPAVRHHAIATVLDETTCLLSELARVGHDDAEATAHAFAEGLGRLQSAGPVPATLPAAAGLDAVDRALDRLAAASPQVKRQVLDACAACITADGRVTAEEAELLRAIADSLDCPMPPLLAERRPTVPA